MFKIKSLTLIALAIFFSGIFMSATAQIRMPPPGFEPPAPVTASLSGRYTVAVTANELSTGTVELSDGETYGWTCYGATEGDFSGHMFVSMNYATPTTTTSFDTEPGHGVGPGTSQVTGGSWSKLIFVDGQYAGSIYGKIVGGEVTWNQDLTATINLQLTADEGTGSFVGNMGAGTFEGVLNPQSKQSTVSGTLVLNY